MIIKSMLSFFPYLLTILFLNSHISNAEEVKELTVSGGIMYTSWVESDSSITCGLTIETPVAVAENREPLQIVLVIDVSRPMEGAALHNAKISAQNILNNLNDKDMFGLVSFSSYARVAFNLQPLNANTRQTALNAIDRLKNEDSRNISEGLIKGAEQFSRFKGQQTAGRYMFLITNGDPDKGVTDQGEILKLAQKFSRTHDMHISTLGYDMYYNEKFLISFAEKTGGRAYFVEEDNVDDIRVAFNPEIERISETFAQDVTLEITIPSGSVIENVYGGALQGQKILVGNIQAGVKQPLFFDIVKRPSRRKDAIVNVDYIKPVKLSSRKIRIYIDIPLGTGEHTYDETYAPMLIEFITLRDLAETIDRVQEDRKTARREYATQFKETFKRLKQENVSIQSDYLSEVLEYFSQIEQDIENSAIEDSLLVKRIKYRFLDLLYGKQVEF